MEPDKDYSPLREMPCPWQTVGQETMGLLLVMSFRSKVFRSFIKWCLNFCSCRAPVVYVLTMYVCFMKLFNLQSTLRIAVTIATDIRKCYASFDMQCVYMCVFVYIYSPHHSFFPLCSRCEPWMFVFRKMRPEFTHYFSRFILITLGKCWR